VNTPLPNRFVVLSAPRSGSNMLSSMLNSHPQILCHHELFNPERIRYALQLRNSDFKLADCIEERNADPLGFLAKAWACDLGMPCTGFKMTHRQNQLIFDTVLADAQVKKIVLKRNNAVKVHVSRLIAEQNDVWEEYGKAQPKKVNQVAVDLDELQRDIDFNQAYYQQIDDVLSQSKQDYLMVEYESLNQLDTQQQLLNYLQLDFQPLTTPSVKQAPTDLRQRIVNFDRLLAECECELIKAQLLDKLS
jgi:LPS sulfotransferase NodH